MTNQEKLSRIKLIHTAIWLFFNLVIFCLLYAVIAEKIDKWVWIGFSLVMGEVLVLAFFKRVCPVTILARKYSDSKKDKFDIYLPEWLARHNKLIYSMIVIFIIIILLIRLSSG